MRQFLAFILLLFAPFIVFAQDAAFAMGGEVNMNAPSSFAAGFNYYFDINIGKNFAAGFILGTSRGFDDFSLFPQINVYEGSLLFRWYFLGKGQRGFFAQAEGGGYLAIQKMSVYGFEFNPMFTAGLRGGYRLPLGRFYLEPFVRAGYPFAAGAGLMLGVRHLAR
jgi:hypothetical protein